MAQRVLLIAATTGYQTTAYLTSGRETWASTSFWQQIDAIMLDDPWGDSALPVRFENPEEAAQALSALNPKPEAVVAVGDRPTLIASLAAMRLGIPFHPPDAVLACRDKFRAREAFAEPALLVPDIIMCLPVNRSGEIAASRDHLSLCPEALGLVGQPRRDSRQRPRGVLSRPCERIRSTASIS